MSMFKGFKSETSNKEKYFLLEWDIISKHKTW